MNLLNKHNRILDERAIRTYDTKVLEGKLGLGNEKFDPNGIARLRLVKSGKIFDDNIEILAGLKDGDTIITHPKAGLKDQYKVTVEVKK